MKNWQRIRLARTDLTDYVIHFTKSCFRKNAETGLKSIVRAVEVFQEILKDGHIRPTFAPIPSKMYGTTSNTVRGPYPAVCLTEQPLSAVLVTRKCAGERYSGFGVAYHKYALYSEGGCPVIYGSKAMMGKQLGPLDAGYEAGKEIYEGGLPRNLQYLWVRYKPTVEYFDDHPIDFTWEREWRYCCRDSSLPLVLERQANLFTPQVPVGALVVERDEHVPTVQGLLTTLVEQGHKWAAKLTRICSLETAERMLLAGDQRYSRIETWPNSPDS